MAEVCQVLLFLNKHGITTHDFIICFFPFQEVILTFYEVKIQPSNNCGKDKLEIWKNVDGSGELVDAFCRYYNNPPGPISIQESDSVTIKFQTNHNGRRRGFQIDWEVKGEYGKNI